MRIIFLYLLKLIVLISLNFFTAVTKAQEETPVTFKTNQGEETNAFEGHFYVPENRENPKSRKIRVNYIRFPATGKSTGAPIVYLSGGPGGSGIATAKWRRFPLFMTLREFGDVIALDQRGTGLSEAPASCQAEQQPATNTFISAEEYLKLYKQGANYCLKQWQSEGIDIYGYNTVQNALDINDLRIHLKAEKVVLWGISYGTHLALAASKLFPEHIEKMILASAEGLNQTVKLPARTDQYLSRLQTVINQQALVQQVPDLKGLMARVHKKAAEKPFEIELVTRDGKPTRIFVNESMLQTISAFMIADPGPRLGMLIQLYLTLDYGVTDLLVGMLQQIGFADEQIAFRLMPLAMDIASGITLMRAKTVVEQAEISTLGLALNFPMPQLSNLDHKLDLGNAFREKPENDIPTLLFSGTLDGRTYPDSQAEAVSGLSNLVHVIVENAGHNLFMSSPEVFERMQQLMTGKPVETKAIELPLPDLTFRPPSR